MFRKFGGLPWQLFFKEKPEFSTPEGEVLVCHFENSNDEFFDLNVFIDSVEFPTSVHSERIPRERQAIQYKNGFHFFRYDFVLGYFESSSVNPLLQDWIFTELDKARRTTEEVEPFKTLSLYLGASFFQSTEEGQTSLSRRYEKLLKESYIPSKGVREIERVLSQYPIDNDPVPYHVKAFFLPLEQEGLVKRVNDYWIIQGGYNLNEFIGIMNRALDPSLKLIELDISQEEKESYLLQKNGERFTHGTWKKGQERINARRKNPLPIPRFMQ